MAEKTKVSFWKKLSRGTRNYFREFWYQRVVNGKPHFVPSSKKFWAQIAQIVLWTTVGLKLFGPESVSVNITDTLIATLTAHAGVAMGWYTWAKHKTLSGDEKVPVMPEDTASSREKAMVLDP